ncbi:hypothetical protein HMPREF9988_04277, partial [Staphylococcus epidermidis NIHLM053]
NAGLYAGMMFFNMDGLSWLGVLVITSYSIHYTKLYEIQTKLNINM